MRTRGSRKAHEEKRRKTKKKVFIVIHGIVMCGMHMLCQLIIMGVISQIVLFLTELCLYMLVCT